LKRATSSAALLLALLGADLAFAADAPTQVVDGLSVQVIAILKDPQLSSAEKRAKVEQIADGAVDFPTLSKLVLARAWSQFSPEQQSEFQTEFRRHLSLTYGRNVDSYQNETVQVLGERPEARGDVTVLTKILRGGGNQDVGVDYRLRRKKEQWKIIDVTIEGVSMVSNFRSQFQDIVANGGPERLLVLLREKNAAGQSLEPVK
jgi:phospholipid transport system substrate-binding protein